MPRLADIYSEGKGKEVDGREAGRMDWKEKREGGKIVIGLGKIN